MKLKQYHFNHLHGKFKTFQSIDGRALKRKNLLSAVYSHKKHFSFLFRNDIAFILIYYKINAVMAFTEFFKAHKVNPYTDTSLLPAFRSWKG